MLFNSIEFLIFLPIVFGIYWLIQGKNFRIQNIFLLVASYFFYGWWDWRFLLLVVFSSAVDYSIGVRLGKTNNKTNRKLLLLTSLSINLGFLGFLNILTFLQKVSTKLLHFLVIQFLTLFY